MVNESQSVRAMPRTRGAQHTLSRPRAATAGAERTTAAATADTASETAGSTSAATAGTTTAAAAGPSRCTTAAAARRAATLATAVIAGGPVITRRRRAAPPTALPSAASTPRPTEDAPVSVSIAQLRELVAEAVQNAINEKQQPGEGIVIVPPPDPGATPASIGLAQQAPSTASAQPLTNTAEEGMLTGMQDITFTDVDFRIPSSLRQSIIEHKFIDLSLLLSTQEPHDSVPLQLVDGRLRTGRQVRQITSFSSWCTAFLRFAGVYLTRHPADAAGLLLHMRHVSHLLQPGMGFAWREFDLQFRRAREMAPHLYQWGATAPTSAIWLSAMVRGIGAVARGGSSIPRSSSRVSASRACFNFNNGGSCHRRACGYTHLCHKCRGPHPAVRCPRSSGVGRGSALQHVARRSAPQPKRD